MLIRIKPRELCQLIRTLRFAHQHNFGQENVFPKFMMQFDSIQKQERLSKLYNIVLTDKEYRKVNKQVANGFSIKAVRIIRNKYYNHHQNVPLVIMNEACHDWKCWE